MVCRRRTRAGEVTPDHLRCRWSVGRQWRCPRRAMDGTSLCDYHHHVTRHSQLKKEVPTNSPSPRREPGPVQPEPPPNRLPMAVRRLRKRRINADEAAPDHLRCRRRDGKKWRCPRRAMDGISFCDYHHQLSRRSQLKKKAPDSGGIDQILNQDGRKKKRRRRRNHRDLLMELIGMVLRRQMERREEKENVAAAAEEVVEEAEVTWDLPNGVMAISPAVFPVGSTGNAVKPVDWKLGFESGSILRWCFRSKNVEPPPLVTSKMFPNGKDVASLGKRGKRICHQWKSNARESSFRRATGKNFSAPGV